MASLTPNYGWYLPGVGDPTDEDLWGGYLNANLSSQDTLIKSISDTANAAAAGVFVPVGAGLDWWGDEAGVPSNFMLAYGQAISRTTYSVLFAKFGTTYGSGDGSTTFNLPDKRGRASAARDNMGGSAASRLTSPINGVTLGAAGGAQNITLTVNQIPSHNHYAGILEKGSGISTFVYGGTTTGVPGSAVFAHDSGYGNTTGAQQAITSSTGGGLAHDNVQPTIVCNYIIRVI